MSFISILCICLNCKINKTSLANVQNKLAKFSVQRGLKLLTCFQHLKIKGLFHFSVFLLLSIGYTVVDVNDCHEIALFLLYISILNSI